MCYWNNKLDWLKPSIKTSSTCAVKDIQFINCETYLRSLWPSNSRRSRRSLDVSGRQTVAVWDDHSARSDRLSLLPLRSLNYETTHIHKQTTHMTKWSSRNSPVWQTITDHVFCHSGEFLSVRINVGKRSTKTPRDMQKLLTVPPFYASKTIARYLRTYTWIIPKFIRQLARANHLIYSLIYRLLDSEIIFCTRISVDRFLYVLCTW